MKSKNPKIQNIFKKGIAIIATGMMLTSPVVYATTSLNNSYLETTWINKLIYGTIGSTVKEIEEFFETHTTLYITNETQLRALAEYVNNGHNCYGKEIILLNDIELSDEEWTPIGKGKSFEGTFNGENHIIKGLTYSRGEKSYDELNFIGLIGILGENGIVKNVISKKFNINVKYREDSNDDYHSAGNIVGYATGTIENCYNESNISGGYNVGGIVGTLSYGGIVKNCYNNGIVVGYKMIGGIVGRSQFGENNKIINCTNEGDVTGNYYIGGICGHAYKTNISYSSNNGKITGQLNTVGGIAGFVENSEITNASNVYDVTGRNYVGGIAGFVQNSKITNASNVYDVTGESTVGGICGYVTETSIVSNVANMGVITGQSSSVGGIAGVNKTSTIQYSINKGGVRGASPIGGIAGYCVNSQINYSYNIIDSVTSNNEDLSTVEVVGVTYTGGIVGSLDNSTVSYCVNNARVCGTERIVGGIVGLTNRGTIEGCSSLGYTFIDVKNWVKKDDEYIYNNSKNPVKTSMSTEVIPESVGGIVGLFYKWDTDTADVTINNCLVAGSLLSCNSRVGGIAGSTYRSNCKCE